MESILKTLEAREEEINSQIIENIFNNIYIRLERGDKFKGVIFYQGSIRGGYDKIKYNLKKRIEENYKKEIRFEEGVVNNEFLMDVEKRNTIEKNVNTLCLIIFDIITTSHETYRNNLEREIYNSYIFIDLEGR